MNDDNYIFEKKYNRKLFYDFYNLNIFDYKRAIKLIKPKTQNYLEDNLITSAISKIREINFCSRFAESILKIKFYLNK